MYVACAKGYAIDDTLIEGKKKGVNIIKGCVISPWRTFFICKLGMNMISWDTFFIPISLTVTVVTVFFLNFL